MNAENRNRVSPLSIAIGIYAICGGFATLHFAIETATASICNDVSPAVAQADAKLARPRILNSPPIGKEIHLKAGESVNAMEGDVVYAGSDSIVNAFAGSEVFAEAGSIVDTHGALVHAERGSIITIWGSKSVITGAIGAWLFYEPVPSDSGFVLDLPERTAVYTSKTKAWVMCPAGSKIEVPARCWITLRSVQVKN